MSARVLGRSCPSRRDKADIEKGLAALERLAAFATGSAVVVARAYILAIAAGETVPAMLGRVRALRQWGMRGKRRLGVLVCRAAELETAAFAAIVRAGRRAGSGRHRAVAGAPEQLAAYEDASRVADELGLFLVTCRPG